MSRAEELAAFERWAERVCPSGDATEVQRQWEASSEMAEWLESQHTEDVLIDGVAYTVPTEIACELLRLHMLLAQVEAEHEALKKAISDAEPIKFYTDIRSGARVQLYTLEGIRK